MEKEVAGLVRLAKGENDAAVQLLKEATAIEETMDPPSGPPEPMKPANELLGEILLELDRSQEALAQFEMALQRMPNRTQSLLGAARSAAKVGNRTAARRYYGDLAKIWGSTALPGLQEARRFLNESEQP
jgi:tetratricopeptide (TPR) repeat protein